MARAQIAPSSISSGFFQELPTIVPAYTRKDKQNLQSDQSSGDRVFDNILRLYLPDPLPKELDQSLHNFARKCIDPDTLRLTVEAEAHQPTLHLLGTFGEANNESPLRTSEGWKALKDIQTRAGIVAHGYKDLSGVEASYNRRVYQFALSHLWSSSSANVTCPAAMSDGAAILISKHLSRASAPSVAGQDAIILRQVLREAYARLTSFDPKYAWTSGQWMTERPGGSDVSRTETVARLASREDLLADNRSHSGQEMDAIDMPLGPYVVDGFKWFSSATDADMVVLLAQTEKGLSAFYAPMKRIALRTNGSKFNVLNGVRISRLKHKLGTQALPTAELEIRGMRAWLLGEEGKGVREISAILNATRLWTASGSVAGWARGLSVAKSFAKIRKIKTGQILAENKQHVKWLANETVKHRACVHFAYLGVALLGLSEAGFDSAVAGTRAQTWLPRSQDEASLLLRVLTPVMKAQCSSWSIWGLRECMESLGGVGYCENQEDNGVLNLARIFRDANVNSIWEGTTNILAEDFVRSVKSATGAEGLAALDRLLNSILATTGQSFLRETSVVSQDWSALKTRITDESGENLLYHGREILQQLQEIVCGCLLMLDAIYSREKAEQIIAVRWISERCHLNRQTFGSTQSIQQQSKHDHIIFNDSCEQDPTSSAQSKL